MLTIGKGSFYDAVFEETYCLSSSNCRLKINGVESRFQLFSFVQIGFQVSLLGSVGSIKLNIP